MQRTIAGTMLKRETGVDLVRCVGLFFVNGIHFFLKNGFYSEPQTGAAMWMADCFRWLFFSCNGLFLLLTGYLKSEKPFHKDYYKSKMLLAEFQLRAFFIFLLQIQALALLLWQEARFSCHFHLM